MNWKQQHIAVIALLLLTAIQLEAQVFMAKVVDSISGEPIPFATVQWAENSGVITNDNGVFSIDQAKTKKDMDSIHISSLGFVTKVFAATQLFQNQELVIGLTPNTLELSTVFLTNRNLNALQVIKRVKDSMHLNYRGELAQKRVFYRQSDASDFEKVGVHYKKSTIPEIDQKLIDSVTGVLPNSAIYYREALVDFYGNTEKHKVRVLKAAELYDNSANASIEGMLGRMESILKKRVKPDSYLKVKSGLFGMKVQLDSIIKLDDDSESLKEELENQAKGNFHNHVRYGFKKLHRNLFYQDKAKLDVIKKSGRYEFELDEPSVMQGESVYVIHFSPKGKKDFKGTLYVNAQDFGVMRMDFENVRWLRDVSLLGLSYRETLFKGIVIFEKSKEGQYSPKYARLQDGRRFGVERGIKIKEKNKYVKGRRKQNEVALDIDFTNDAVVTYEYFVLENNAIGQTAYNSARQNKNVKAVYLPAYDPGFWEGHAVIAPNEALRTFAVAE